MGNQKAEFYQGRRRRRHETQQDLSWNILSILLACTVYLIYTIVRDPIGSYGLDYILLALGVTAGFIVLDRQKRKKLKAKEL